MPERSGKLEHGARHVRATLEHVIRDPTIAQHAGWRQDAEGALAWLDQQRGAVSDCPECERLREALEVADPRNASKLIKLVHQRDDARARVEQLEAELKTTREHRGSLSIRADTMGADLNALTHEIAKKVSDEELTQLARHLRVKWSLDRDY